MARKRRISTSNSTLGWGIIALPFIGIASLFSDEKTSPTVNASNTQQVQMQQQTSPTMESSFSHKQTIQSTADSSIPSHRLHQDVPATQDVIIKKNRIPSVSNLATDNSIKTKTQNTSQTANVKKKGNITTAQCSGKRLCKQMSICAEARFYLNQCGLDRLDRDGDGIPCESLCLSKRR